MKDLFQINPLELAVTSYFLTPSQLFYVRVGCLVYTLAMTAWTLSIHIEVYLSFFTNWSWLGLCFYFTVMLFLLYFF